MEILLCTYLTVRGCKGARAPEVCNRLGQPVRAQAGRSGPGLLFRECGGPWASEDRRGVLVGCFKESSWSSWVITHVERQACIRDYFIRRWFGLVLPYSGLYPFCNLIKSQLLPTVRKSVYCCLVDTSRPSPPFQRKGVPKPSSSQT